VQNQFTIVKVRSTKQGHVFIKGLLAGQTGVEFNQRESPWLMYWCQWYDPWSLTIQLVHDLPLRLRCERNYQRVYSLVDPQAARTLLEKRLRRKYQFAENSWFHRNLLEAIRAYEGLCPARILLHTKCTGSSLGDEELFGSTKRNERSKKQ
jgi:hypothetical protein